jgi:hypothetical protein
MSRTFKQKQDRRTTISWETGFGLKPSVSAALRSDGESLPGISVRSKQYAERINMLVVSHRKIKTMTANATTTLITSPMIVFGGEGMGVQLIVPGVYRKTSVGVWS